MSAWRPETGPGRQPAPPLGGRRRVTLGEAVLRPVGPLPPSRYWVRRAVVLLVVVAVLVLVVVAASGSSGTPRGAAGRHPSSGSGVSPAPSAPAGTSRSASSSANPSAPCAPSTLSLAIATGAATYPAGTTLHLQVTVSDAGPACLLAAGPTIVITSGADRIWGSTDCAKSQPLELTHGSATLVVSWNGERSKPGCLPPGNGVTTPAPGVYHASASLDARSASTRFTLD